MVMIGKCIAILFLITSIGSAQEVHLTARTDAETFKIGSWIDVHVYGKFDAVLESIVPVVKDSLGPLEVVAVERNAAEPKWLIRLTTVDSGKVFLPPIEFGYKIQGDTSTRKAYTNSLLLTISGTTVDPQGEIKDIKPPLNAPWLVEDFVPYIIALAVIAALAGGYYYYRRKKKQKIDMLADVKVFIPPHREALTALRVLEEKKLWQQGIVKGYYSEITGIIRWFFERRWNIIALEMTTDEILMQMKRIPEALMLWKEMESFFLTADLVKFAKYLPSPAEHENEMHTAYEIVRAMTPKASIETESQTEEVDAHVR